METAPGTNAGTGTGIGAGVSFVGVDPALVPALTDAALLSQLSAAFAARRAADAAIARLSGEIVERSRDEFGVDGLARRSGHSNPRNLLAALGRIGGAEAARYCTVGAATAARFSISGEKLPPTFETLASGVDAVVVTVEAAAHIITNLNLARRQATPEGMAVAEVALVEFAAVAPADDVRKVAVQWMNHLDTDGVEPREDALVRARSLKRFWLSNGLKRFQLDADPERAAYLDAVIDAEIAAAFRATRRPKISGGDEDCDDDCEADCETDGNGQVADGSGASNSRPGSVIEDTRTPAQIGADVLTDMARHVLGCENTTPALATTTVVVRMTLDQLSTGSADHGSVGSVGSASSAGSAGPAGAAQIGTDEQPISASTARRLAVDANIIPVILGGKSEILDWGRSRRLFTRTQKAAILERDGGCICGCGRPGVYLKVHHIDWWKRDRGRTNLDRGVLLCSRAHTMVHTHGWDIRFIDNHPHLIPPRSIDPKQTPRRGGRPPTPLRR